MNPNLKKTLEARLRLLEPHERRKLYKKAAEIRRAAQTPTSRHLPVDEEGIESVKMRPVKSALDDLVLKLLAEHEPQELKPYVPSGNELTVLGVTRRSAEVQGPDGPVSVRISQAVKEADSLVVGDLVIVDWSLSIPLITAMAPRKTKLSRPDPGNANKERMVVANVDTVGIVVSVHSPPLHPRIIDRYLIAVERGGARPILCVNKIDQLQDPTELDALEPYRGLGLPIVLCSATTGQGMDELKALLTGHLAAFVGHSGVGKSSLLNALKPELDLEVGHLMRKWARGAHTTTSSHLWEVGNGTRIIDTPGIREFGLWRIDASELSEFFPEFDSVACKFRDCLHLSEPGCGVRDAVDRGEIRPERLDTYRRLRADMDT